MAGFTGFGQDIIMVAKACALNMNAADMAEFLAAQQDMIQDRTIKERLEGKKPGQSGESGGKKSKSASEAYARLKAMADSLK